MAKGQAKMTELIIINHNGINVVRDDLYPGGTKARVLDKALPTSKAFVYASPVYGYAQIALAHICKSRGVEAHIFCAKRKYIHPRTQEAKLAGAVIHEIPCGYLSVVTARAREFSVTNGASLLPFGLDMPGMVDAIADLALTIQVAPSEVWSVAGSGTLQRGLQKAWPEAVFHAVKIGAEPKAGRAKLWSAPEKFEKDAKIKPPFPSCTNYDAKAWRFIIENAKPEALFWNVAS
jgi:hypothetical protein